MVCYVCSTDIADITSKSKHTLNYPDLPSTMRHVQNTEQFPVTKHPENLTFSDEISDFDEDHEQQEGDNVDCDPNLKQDFFFHLNPIYKHQEILMTLSVNLICLKRSRNLLFETKSVESSPPRC